jgi:hypothetical protein
MSLPIHHHAPSRPDAVQLLAGDLTLRRGRVHEFCGPSRAMLAALVMAKSAGPVVWIRPGWVPERLNTAGLQPLADPARLILAQADRDEGLLWAMEESLRSGAAPLVVAECLAPPGLTPIRRLHLAAEAGAETHGTDSDHLGHSLYQRDQASGQPCGQPAAGRPVRPLQPRAGHEVMFICATDEHGTPAELAAAKAGKPVDEYCAEMHQVQKAWPPGSGCRSTISAGPPASATTA